MLEKRREELYVRIQDSDESIENEYYVITANNDGSINVLDKKSGIIYKNLNTLVSRGEAGDEYQHVLPLIDSHIFARVKSISVVKNSPISQRLNISASMMISDKIRNTFITRSKMMKECEVTLLNKDKRIDFNVNLQLLKLMIQKNLEILNFNIQFI